MDLVSSDRRGHVGRRHQDRHAVLDSQPIQQRHRPLPLVHAKIARRVVDQQQLRPPHNRMRERHQRPLAVRQLRPCECTARLVEPKLAQCRACTPARLRAGHRADQRKGDVVEHRQLPLQRTRPVRDTDVVPAHVLQLIARQLVERTSLEPNDALVRPIKSGRDTQQRRLARAESAPHGDQLAASDFKRNTTEHLHSHRSPPKPPPDSRKREDGGGVGLVGRRHESQARRNATVHDRWRTPETTARWDGSDILPPRVGAMSVPIVVLIGAGASYASGDFAAANRPPLTRDLFATDKAKALLRTYLLANNASRAIRSLMHADDTVAFEQALRSLREDDENPHLRQLSLALPPYLQALMLAYSEDLHADAERYSLLIIELLKLKTHIIFVSLNYDTLLDSNLGAFSPLDSIGDYVSDTRKWSLIKPHGSANWFTELARPFDPTRPPEDLVVVRRPIESVPVERFSLRSVRGNSNSAHGPTRRYPALALPEGPKDDLVLPPQHRDHFVRRLSSAWEIDVLVLGYSALDTEVLDLLARSEAKIRRMTVVNRSPESALNVYHRIRSHGVEAIWPDTFDGSYESWIDGGGLRRWVREFGGVGAGKPYPSLVDPEDLRRLISSRATERRLRGVETERISLRRPPW